MLLRIWSSSQLVRTVVVLLLLLAGCTAEWQAVLGICTTKAVLTGGASLADKLLDDIDADLAHRPGAFNEKEWQAKAFGAGIGAVNSELACIAAHLLADLDKPTRLAGPGIGHGHRQAHARHRRHLEALARRCYVRGAP